MSANPPGPPPDWRLPAGVDRGLWDYLHSRVMAAGYDGQTRPAGLAAADLAVCARVFARPGPLVDVGCGTGRLAVHFAAAGFPCTGVDLSAEMLDRARSNATAAGAEVAWVAANIVDLAPLPPCSFDYAACLFSTLGMVRGAGHRAAAVAAMHRVLRPGGRLVLHAHNRYFRGLGRGRVVGQLARTLAGRPTAGDVTMPQAYAGAPLTLHHFTRRGLTRSLAAGGFRADELLAVGPAGDTRPAARWGDPTRAYGFIAVATRGRVLTRPSPPAAYPVGRRRRVLPDLRVAGRSSGRPGPPPRTPPAGRSWTGPARPPAEPSGHCL